MTEISINGVPHKPVLGSSADGISQDRLRNNFDVQAIEKAVTYLDRVSFEQLPILPTRVCVLAGVSAQVPVMVKIKALPPESEPNGRTMFVTSEWLRPLPSDDDDDDEAPNPDDDNAQGTGTASPWGDDDEPPF